MSGKRPQLILFPYRAIVSSPLFVVCLQPAQHCRCSTSIPLQPCRPYFNSSTFCPYPLCTFTPSISTCGIFLYNPPLFPPYQDLAKYLYVPLSTLSSHLSSSIRLSPPLSYLHLYPPLSTSIHLSPTLSTSLHLSLPSTSLQLSLPLSTMLYQSIYLSLPLFSYFHPSFLSN